MERLNKTTYEFTLCGGDKVEVGDKESTDFKPHIKLNRWGGECFQAISFPTKEKRSCKVEGDKRKWSSEKVDIDFYPLEPTTVDGFTQNELGGFEFEIILKEKPASNKIVLNIETQGLKFYYQPELTPEEIADGAVRPDNVVGSYAVYHATRTNMHRSKEDADKYKCGKAFHIYRPKVTDANGDWVWADLSLNEAKGTLTITINQTWLDSALYPVSIDPNFGHEGVGGSSTITGGHRIQGTQYPCPESGSALSITCYLKQVSTYTPSIKYAVYKTSDDSLVGYTEEGEVTLGFDDWKTLNIISGGSLIAADYCLVHYGDDDYGWYYDTLVGAWWYQELAYTSFPNPWSPSGPYDYKVSIYCTYTEVVVGQPYISRVQRIAGMKTIGVNL